MLIALHTNPLFPELHRAPLMYTPHPTMTLLLLNTTPSSTYNSTGPPLDPVLQTALFESCTLYCAWLRFHIYLVTYQSSILYKPCLDLALNT
jgi:hypothetical protein